MANSKLDLLLKNTQKNTQQPLQVSSTNLFNTSNEIHAEKPQNFHLHSDPEVLKALNRMIQKKSGQANR
jgi:hypothetical protein